MSISTDFVDTTDKANQVLTVEGSEALVDELIKNLDKLSMIVKKMPIKSGGNFIDWIRIRADYLGKESDFNPQALKAYSRGEVIFVNLGFNIGAEYGGEHFGVVIADSNKANPGINIVPLTSYKDKREGEDLQPLTEEEIKASLHSNSVYLGNISDINEKKSIALVDQMQYISKIKVKSPKSRSQQVIKVTNEHLDLLDEKIRKVYTKKAVDTE